jgi:hypothetical protein
VRAAPKRALLWVGPNSDADSPDNDPTHAAKWPLTRAIRAAFIVWLAADPQARAYVHPSGVGFGGALITGRLDLSYLTLNFPLTIMSSAIPQGIDFSFAHLRGLDLSRDVTGPVMGDRSTAEGDVLLTGGNYGPTSLFRIEIDGSLDCSGGQFLGGDSPLSMIEATIRGDASFHQGFTTNGVVDLRLAQIGRGLSFNHARFIGSGENGLTAERSTINEALYWVDITRTPRTELDLTNAHVGSLWDDPLSWPASGRLLINGFVYGAISGGRADAQSRLEWLERQPSGLSAAALRPTRPRGARPRLECCRGRCDDRRRERALARERTGMGRASVARHARRHDRLRLSANARALVDLILRRIGRDDVRMGLSGTRDHTYRPRGLRRLRPKWGHAAPLSSVQRHDLLFGELPAARRLASGNILAS